MSARRCTVLLVVALCGCRPGQQVRADAQKEISVTGLANRLTELGYDRLFLSDDKDLNGLWDRSAAELMRLALSGPEDHARFLAAEVMFRKGADRFPPGDEPTRASLGRVYAAALREAREANPFGLPGKLDEPVGQHVVQLGAPAVPALLPLLSDERAIRYGGSQEAMVGNRYAYRVKDLAAFFVARIRGVPYEVKLQPGERDAEIARLQQ